MLAAIVDEHKTEREAIEEYLSGHSYSCKKCYAATPDSGG